MCFFLSSSTALDERQLIFELVKDICNDLDVRSLCHKILQNVSMLTSADRCSLFLVRGEREEPERHFFSTLFDVSPDSTLEQIESKEEIRVPWGTGIVGYVATAGEPVHISDCYHDERFSDVVDKKTGYKTRNMLCAPIFDIFGEVMGVAQVINKTTIITSKDCDQSSSSEDADFDDKDMQVFSQYLQFCGIGLRNAQLFERSQLENKRNQVLLDLARMVFEEQSTLEHIVYRIMVHIQSLLEVERCQILLIADSDSSEYSNDARKTFCRVFDLEASDVSEAQSGGEQGKGTHNSGPCEGRFPINVGITGYVATTGENLNIPDAYNDPRFDRHVDDNSLSGFRHQSILCMPIKNASGLIIGVSQLVNKMNGRPFSRNDENLFEAFAIFCGMGIHNVQMYEKVVKSAAKQKVTFEILSYHATSPLEDAQKLAKAVVPSTAALKLTDLRFSDFVLDEDNMVKACLRMFLDLDLIQRFNMDYGVLCRWLLSVRKNYRPVTYHNWRHAFNVAQMMFAILTATGLVRVLGEIETLGLLVACLCHDLDHRGTNNSFQVKSCSPLAQLYSTSVMERHHFDQCLMILNSDGNQILSSLSPEEYRHVIHVLEEAILATDIAVYFKNRGVFFKLIQSEEYDVIFSNEESSGGRRLLRGMLMTACDIAAITKPWEVQRVVAQLVASEFFEQGDIEKRELHLEPIDMMNREKQDQLPKMQVSFIDSVCLPVYEAFAKVFPEHLTILLEGVLDNREHWLSLAQEKDTLRDWAAEEASRQIVGQKSGLRPTVARESCSR